MKFGVGTPVRDGEVLEVPGGENGVVERPVGGSRVVDPAALEFQRRARAGAVVDPATRTVAESEAAGD
ncbi:MAG: hypothetical protein J4F44_05710, partial [Acidimicrobiia bacterium]|nr:hypothetical protein [Acidimicrobiia bacterium]